MIKREFHIFLTAIMFYTRIPCPSWVDHNADYLSRATGYFPLIGWITGAASWLILIAGQHFFSVEISVLLSIAGGVIITGAFHEDGFADVCDGFGGGWTKEKILDIMKDSRVGTYGATGLILILLLKFYSLVSLNSRDLYLSGLVMITAHSLSRFFAVVIIFTSGYVRNDNDSKAKPVATQLSNDKFYLAMFFGLLPLMLLSYRNVFFMLLVIPGLAATFYLRKYFNRWIGGYTGDCLGATQQVNEVVIYLTVLVLWNFI